MWQLNTYFIEPNLLGSIRKFSKAFLCQVIGVYDKSYHLGLDDKTEHSAISSSYVALVLFNTGVTSVTLPLSTIFSLNTLIKTSKSGNKYYKTYGEIEPLIMTEIIEYPS